MNKSIKISILGMGYVGLPLAIEFGKIFEVKGYDINPTRINELKNNNDITKEINKKEFISSKKLTFTTSLNDLIDNDVYIITVPTPVDNKKKPNLSFLKEATKFVGRVMKINSYVIYESTVFPGATEEICVPILENTSNLLYNSEFFVGYSPERINPGDKKHRITDMIKVTSGSTESAAKFIDDLYKCIIKPGTYMAETIKIAEAAKVIENVQRDLNISLVNELSIIFDKMNIDTEQVLNAASTKWNFIKYKPGLVGGHCIGVDPYYLTYKSQMLGYKPKVILAGRKINDGMGDFAIKKLLVKMVKKNINIKTANTLIMGFTFKENCTDIRNTQVQNLFFNLQKQVASVEVFDPYVNDLDKLDLPNINFTNCPQENSYDAILIVVSHKEFLDIGLRKIKSFGKKNHVLFDFKNLFSKKNTDLRL